MPRGCEVPYLSYHSAPIRPISGLKPHVQYGGAHHHTRVNIMEVPHGACSPGRTVIDPKENGSSLSIHLCPPLDPHLLCCHIWTRPPSARRSWYISWGVRRSHALSTSRVTYSHTHSTTMVDSNTLPSTSASPLDTSHRKPRTIVLCFDGTGNRFCDRVRRCVITTSTQTHH